jgi:hypothetical protein
MFNSTRCLNIFVMLSFLGYLSGCAKPPTTPLMWAAQVGDLATVKSLVKQGAGVNDLNPNGVSVLFHTTFYKHVDVAQFLLENGASPANENERAIIENMLREKGFRLSPHRQLLDVPSAGHSVPVLAADTSKKIEQEQDYIYKIDSDGKQNKALSPSGQFNYGRYFAIVIGNNNYQYLPSLKTPHQDANDIAKILENDYGFKVKILLDAKRVDIITTLSSYREKLGKQDNLLIYYAGHGWLDKDGDEGYWLPVDATKNDELNWVSNSSITTALKAMEAKHVLIIADSCYSGKLARGLHITQKAPDYYSRISQKRARSVMASGGLEPVIDSGGKGNHSVFATALIDTLRENQNIIDGNELFNKIRRPIMLVADQTPEYADIRKAGHDGGDFLFVKQK